MRKGKGTHRPDQGPLTTSPVWWQMGWGLPSGRDPQKDGCSLQPVLLCVLLLAAPQSWFIPRPAWDIDGCLHPLVLYHALCPQNGNNWQGHGWHQDCSQLQVSLSQGSSWPSWCFLIITGLWKNSGVQDRKWNLKKTWYMKVYMKKSKHRCWNLSHGI